MKILLLSHIFLHHKNIKHIFGEPLTTKFMNSQTYKVKVNGELDFEINEKQVDFSILPLPNNTYHTLAEHKSLDVKIVSEDFNKRTYCVELFGKVYEVYIGNPLDNLIEALGLETKEILRIDELKAPMPGLITEVRVATGDNVEEGQTLLVLNAMKMENSISSPRSGVIKSVEVTANEAVEKNQLLILFEKSE